MCNKVTTRPSLEKLTLVLVRNWCGGVLRDVGRRELARAMVKKRKIPAAKAAHWRDEKECENL